MDLGMYCLIFFVEGLSILDLSCCILIPLFILLSDSQVPSETWESGAWIHSEITNVEHNIIQLITFGACMKKTVGPSLRPPGTLLKKLSYIKMNIYTQFTHVFRHPRVSTPKHRMKQGKNWLLKCCLRILIGLLVWHRNPLKIFLWKWTNNVILFKISGGFWGQN